MRTFAKIISYLFHPLLMPVIGLWLVFTTNEYMQFAVAPEVQRALYIIVFISTFVFPFLSALLLLFTNRIQSLEMVTAKERRLPYLLTAIYYTVGYYMITTKIPLPEEIAVMLLGANLSVVLTLIINIVRKISAHAVAVGGLIGAFVGIALSLPVDITVPLSILFLLAGLIGYARLQLKAHQPIEVYAGYALGFTCEFVLFFFFIHTG